MPPIAETLRTVALSVVLIAPLAGCGTTDRIVTSSIALDDYHARHPIVIAEDRTSLDLFPSEEDGRLDRHTAKQILAFAEGYREFGHGQILMLVPRGRGAIETASSLAAIRRVLAHSGARGAVQESTYPVADPRLASPVRLSFVGIRAKVADQCGQWPSDLASGSSIEGWQNKTYWNFGCSTQSMIAAQTADPRDLVEPRGEEPADTVIRARAIESVRKGADPNTAWSNRNSNIGSVGGN